MRGGGDYFETHDVAGLVVERSVRVNLKRYGYEGPQLEVDGGNFLYREVTAPVSIGEKGLFVIRALEHRVKVKEENERKPRHTLVMLGGGASEALGNTKMVAGAVDALQGLKEELPFAVDRIVMLPHVSGSLGEEDIPREKWPDVYGAYAKVLSEVLHTKELSVTGGGDNIGLFNWRIAGDQVGR